MKTLIINGSPRKNGDTEALINALAARLEGEIKTVTWRDDISPCLDCRFCWEHDGCAISDGMQAVYDFWRECDNVVFTSPVWYSSLSGPALNIASRFQTSFMARFHRKIPSPATKNGVLIFTGGQPGTEKNPEESARIILRNMNVKTPLVSVIKSMDTDNIPAKDDAAAIAMAEQAADALNALGRQLT